MDEVSVIGLDLAKHVFQVHGADALGRVVIPKQLRRVRCWSSLVGSPGAWWRWRLVRARTSGGGSLGGLDTRCD
jgi:hypothetical protein